MSDSTTTGQSAPATNGAATKADQDKARRAIVAKAKQGLERAGLEFEHEPKSLTIKVNGEPLTGEQKERAATFENGHAGLTGKALAAYIMEGKTARQQQNDARQAAKPRKE